MAKLTTTCLVVSAVMSTSSCICAYNAWNEAEQARKWAGNIPVNCPDVDTGSIERDVSSVESKVSSVEDKISELSMTCERDDSDSNSWECRAR